MAARKKSNGYKKKVVKHLKGDIKTFKKEAEEDRELIKKLKKDGSKKKDPKKSRKKDDRKKEKVERVMHEWKEGELHSGSKKGPNVTNKKQAVAIALSEARKLGKKKRKASR